MKTEEFMEILRENGIPHFHKDSIDRDNYEGYYHFYQENPNYDYPNDGRVIVIYQTKVNEIGYFDKEEVEEIIDSAKTVLEDEVGYYIS